MIFVADPTDVLRRINAFLMGGPGTGKTWQALKFPNPVYVDMSIGRLTMVAQGWDFPTLCPTTEEDLYLMTLQPEATFARLVEAVPRWKGYEPKTWVFDDLAGVEDVIMGRGPLKVGDMRLGATGIMRMEHKRESPETPGITDSNLFDTRIKGFMKMLRAMPYHTILIAHAAPAETATSNKDLGAKYDEKGFKTYPVVRGKVKYSIAGGADMTLELFRRGGQFLVKTEPSGASDADIRSRVPLPRQLDITNTSLYDVIIRAYNSHKPLAVAGKEER